MKKLEELEPLMYRFPDAWVHALVKKLKMANVLVGALKIELTNCYEPPEGEYLKTLRNLIEEFES